MQLNLKRNTLLSANRRWIPPTLTLAIGVASLVVGGAVFHSAWNGDVKVARSCTELGCYTTETDSYSEAKDRAGLVLMPVGAVITIVSTVLLIVRLSRTARLRRVERQIEKLGGQLTFHLAPSKVGLAANTALLRW